MGRVAIDSAFSHRAFASPHCVNVYRFQSRPIDYQHGESASNCVQNTTVYGSISGVEASKANCINSVYGAGDGNPTHVRSLGSLL